MLEHSDMLEYVKKLCYYRAPFITMINATRNYHYALYLADQFEKVVHHYESDLTDRELDDIHFLMLHLRLNSFDKLDRWNAYVDLYEQYDKQELSFGPRALLQAEKQRYQVNKRKMDKASKSEKLCNLYHHPQSELTDDQIEEREQIVLKWITTLN